MQKKIFIIMLFFLFGIFLLGYILDFFGVGTHVSLDGWRYSNGLLEEKILEIQSSDESTRCTYTYLDSAGTIRGELFVGLSGNVRIDSTVASVSFDDIELHEIWLDGTSYRQSLFMGKVFSDTWDTTDISQREINLDKHVYSFSCRNWKEDVDVYVLPDVSLK